MVNCGGGLEEEAPPHSPRCLRRLEQWATCRCFFDKSKTGLWSAVLRLSTVVPDGLLFYRRCFLGSHICEAPRQIAAKLCYMIAIWLKSPNVGDNLGVLP